ncbi:MAG: cation:proton antiporter, partial [Phycisphaerae bacterium]|nr:cation:proton antiporter [Phycisphaerae bacterium]
MNHLADGTTVLAAASVERGMVIDLVVILATSAIVAMIMQRLRLAVIPAYLLAGALVGPRALGLVPAPEALGAVSHLAIILLLFSIGLELHVSVLKHRFLQIALAGSTSCLLCSLVGWPVGMAFGLSGSAALAVAMALTLSSTAVVLRILAQRREMHRMSSRLAL